MTKAYSSASSINSAGTLSQSVWACNWAKADAIVEEYYASGIISRLEFEDGSALTLAYENGYAVAEHVDNSSQQ